MDVLCAVESRLRCRAYKRVRVPVSVQQTQWPSRCQSHSLSCVSVFVTHSFVMICIDIRYSSNESAAQPNLLTFISHWFHCVCAGMCVCAYVSHVHMSTLVYMF